MALFPQDALNDGVRKREVFGWATMAWTGALALSSLLVMLTMPALGAFADLRAAKKRLLLFSTAGCVVTTLVLARVGPGDLAWAVAAVVLSNLFYSYGESLIAAFLPELARRDSLGRVSGRGWSFGYFGGMLTLGLSLAYVMWVQGQGIPASQFVPVTILITAAVYALASIATFALLRERAVPQVALAQQQGMVASFTRLLQTWRDARRFEDFAWLLACAVAYQAGISVVIALAAVYAEQVLVFKQTETMMLIFLVNIAAALGAFAWGYVQDRLGHRPALAITLVGWIVMTLLAGLATEATLFWIAAVIAGLCMGSSQSAGRALAGAFSPEQRRAEFYCLWTFATRASAIVGPLTYGVVTLLTQGLRPATRVRCHRCGARWHVVMHRAA